ncbi:helix-turn-helix transcriptional regulator [Paratractidigestivibacter sp.]|uniref:helix-turn-helix domain-containing protein n=1 Tax=Paratractidigestivibacter sp. TaxID=2847316 RepID=UPI002AC94DCA|nr:helix-turn-helix transcriptional regulator [Paratractidigestivibacter sp.]
MTPAYDEVYLAGARQALGRALNYATCDCGMELNTFYQAFLASRYAGMLERGDFRVTAGMSGIELARRIAAEAGLKTSGAAALPDPSERTGRGAEYWAGWALAWYQWKTTATFAEIDGVVPIERVVGLYSPYHEMDITAFGAKMDALHREARPETELKRRRRMVGLTQKNLSERSGVPLRSIQRYEQRQKDINKASFDTVVALAVALYCPNPLQLMERVPAAPDQR